jgi:glycosyltransferase involved in cell wall biosynthesis
MAGNENNISRRVLSSPDGLHIAMVVRAFSPHGGLELYTHKLVEGLLSNGLRVTVICEENESSLNHPKLRVIKFPGAPSNVAKSQKILHHYKYASKAIADNGPFDLVHSQHLPIDYADVVTFHNHTVHRLSHVGRPWEAMLNNFKIATSKAYRLRDSFDRRFCESVSCLVFTSDACRQDFLKTYDVSKINPHASSVVAYPGADLISKNAALSDANELNFEPPGSSTKPITFLFVGKGYRKKGLDILLAACKILKDQGKEFRLNIAGLSAKTIDRLRLFLLGLNEHVFYLGFRKDMGNVYREASAIVLPSRVEPFGMAALQGMLHGLVPIVSKVSGIAEILHNGKDALILNDHLDPAALAKLMRSLIEDRSKLETLERGALSMASTVTWNKTVSMMIDAYKDILAKKYIAIK